MTRTLRLQALRTPRDSTEASPLRRPESRRRRRARRQRKKTRSGRLLRLLRDAFDDVPLPRKARSNARPLATTIASARDRRLLRLEGRVRCAKDAHPLVSPLTLERCVYLWIQVEGWFPPTKGKSFDQRWRPLIDDQRLCERFWLEDDTGEALIEAQGSAPEATARIEALLPAFSPLPTELLARLRKDRNLAPRLVANRRYRYRLISFADNDRLAIFGLGRREPDPNPRHVTAYRQHATRLHVVPPWFRALRVDQATDARTPKEE